MARWKCDKCGIDLVAPNEETGEPAKCPLCGRIAQAPQDESSAVPGASQEDIDIAQDVRDDRYITAAAEGALAKREAGKIRSELKAMGACYKVANVMANQMIEHAAKGSYLKAMAWLCMGIFVIVTGVSTLLAGNVQRPGKLIGAILFCGFGGIIFGLVDMCSAGKYRTVAGLKQAWCKDMAELE
jgi:hypothetical protein